MTGLSCLNYQWRMIDVKESRATRVREANMGFGRYSANGGVASAAADGFASASSPSVYFLSRTLRHIRQRRTRPEMGARFAAALERLLNA
jgi:hypothetical protein